MPSLVLKIDVDTYRGTQEGVPHLIRLLNQHQAHASFLFSLGPDHTGWALRRVFRPGFFQKVSRTSVLEHYGLKTLLYGVLLPAPDIGVKSATILRTAHRAGFECGIHTWDHVTWQDNVRTADDLWTKKQMQSALNRFVDIFGFTPPTHGAAGWQMNPYALQKLDRLHMAYASDTRAALCEDGSLCTPDIGPYRIQGDHGPLSCIQLPTTLPTLDELLGRTIHGTLIDTTNVAATLLALTATPRDHVYTLHAELEGQKLAPVFEQLLSGWRAQGYDLLGMGDYYQRVKDMHLPTRPIHWGTLPGRSGEVMMAPSEVI